MHFNKIESQIITWQLNDLSHFFLKDIAIHVQIDRKNLKSGALSKTPFVSPNSILTNSKMTMHFSKCFLCSGDLTTMSVVSSNASVLLYANIHAKTVMGFSSIMLEVSFFKPAMYTVWRNLINYFCFY